MNEKVAVLTHDQTIFILGGENIMEPDTIHVVSYVTIREQREHELRCVWETHICILCPQCVSSSWPTNNLSTTSTCCFIDTYEEMYFKDKYYL
jgi:hypothetical protein